MWRSDLHKVYFTNKSKLFWNVSKQGENKLKFQLPGERLKAILQELLSSATQSSRQTLALQTIKTKSGWLLHIQVLRVCSTRTKEQHTEHNSFFWLILNAGSSAVKQRHSPVGIKPCSDLKEPHNNFSLLALFHLKCPVAGIELTNKTPPSPHDEFSRWSWSACCQGRGDHLWLYTWTQCQDDF